MEQRISLSQRLALICARKLSSRDDEVAGTRSAAREVYEIEIVAFSFLRPPPPPISRTNESSRNQPIFGRNSEFIQDWPLKHEGHLRETD